MTIRQFPKTRSLLLAGLITLVTLPALQGCFPLVAGGAASAALVYSDRRTSGAYVEDQRIEWAVRNQTSTSFGDAANIGVVSFNRNVLLLGQAAAEATRTEAARIAANVENVRGVVNEIEIAGFSTLATKSNDTVITSLVKSRFVNDSSFSANHIKVVTESNVVYLMGQVTRKEADAATEVARNTRGVSKVVRVFEYISDDEATRLDRTIEQNRGKVDDPTYQYTH